MQTDLIATLQRFAQHPDDAEAPLAALRSQPAAQQRSALRAALAHTPRESRYHLHYLAARLELDLPQSRAALLHQWQRWDGRSNSNREKIPGYLYTLATRNADTEARHALYQFETDGHLGEELMDYQLTLLREQPTPVLSVLRRSRVARRHTADALMSETTGIPAPTFAAFAALEPVARLRGAFAALPATDRATGEKLLADAWHERQRWDKRHR